MFFASWEARYMALSCSDSAFLIYKVSQLEKLRGVKAWMILLGTAYFVMLVATVEV